MVNPIQSLSVEQAKTMMTAPSAAVTALWNSIPKIDSVGNCIKAICSYISIKTSQVAFNLGMKNTTYGIAYIKDKAPAAIRKQMEKVVTVASNDFLALKHAANQDGTRVENQGTKRAIASFKKQVNDLTTKAQELAKAHGKTDGASVNSVAQALSAMFTDAAAASEIAPDYSDAIAQHYVLNRGLKSGNVNFASQPMSSVTEASFNTYLTSIKTAFASIFSANEVTVKLLKTLVPKLAEMISFRDSHIDAAGVARVNAETAIRVAPFQRTIDESVARVNALRGTNGFNGLINDAHVAHLNTLKIAIKTVGNANAMINAGSALDETIINAVDAIDVSKPEALAQLQAIYAQVVAMAPGQNLDSFLERFALLEDNGEAVVASLTAYRQAAANFDRLTREYATFGGATFNPQVDVLNGVFVVEANSIIALAQAQIPAVRPVVEAEVAAVASFWNRLIPRVEEVKANLPALKQVQGEMVNGARVEKALVTTIGTGL